MRIQKGVAASGLGPPGSAVMAAPRRRMVLPRPTRRAYRRLPALLSVPFLLPSCETAVFSQPARVIMIRHAEKPAEDADPGLTPKGLSRAQRLVDWLAEEKILGGKEPPAALYAAEPNSQGRGVRCVQTLEPVARRLGLRIRTPHRPGEYAKLARHLLSSSSLRGRIVVVCWTHEELPSFAAALGITPKPAKWKDGDYSSAYLITFEGGGATLERVKQKKPKA